MTHVCGLCGFLLVLHGEQAALQHAQCGRTILDLALLILHAHHDAGRNVGHTNGGICGVHGLATRAGAHEDVDFQILLIDFNLIIVFVSFREHNDTGRGSLDATLRFGDGNTLHAMHATLILEGRPYAIFRRRSTLGANGKLHVFDATQLGGVFALHGDRPATLFRISHVHAQQIARKKRRFLAASARLDFHDRVTRIIGIARNQRGTQLLLRRWKLALQTFRLFREIRIFGSHFLGCLQIVFHLLVCGVCGNDDAQLSVTTSQLTHLIRIRRDFRLGHLLFDIVIFLKCGNCRGELLVCQCTPFLSAYKSALQRERFAELHSIYPSYKVPWKRCRSAVFRRHSTHLTNIPIACTQRMRIRCIMKNASPQSDWRFSLPKQ